MQLMYFVYFVGTILTVYSLIVALILNTKSKG